MPWQPLTQVARRVPPRLFPASPVRSISHFTQLASGFCSNLLSAFEELCARQHRCAQPCCTTGRLGSTAARRHIDLNPTNDLGPMGAIVLAYISSSTLLTHTHEYVAHSNMATHRGCARCARLGGPCLHRGV